MNSEVSRMKIIMWYVLLCLVEMLIKVEAVCPTGRLRVNNSWMRCVTREHCQGRNLVIYGSTCQRVCPYNTYIHEDSQTCFDQCPNNTVTYKSRCVNGTFCSSQNNQVLYNGSCHTTCPSVAPFTQHGVCVSTCPSETLLINDSRCFTPTECKQNGGFISNSFCVRKCPTEKPFQLLQVCFAECPENSFIGRNETCLSKQKCITENQGVIFNKTCTTACPKEAKYESSGVCYATCPNNTFVHGTECLSETSCASSNMVIHGHTCVVTCPNEAPYLKNNHCLPRCPEGTVVYNGGCIRVHDCIDFDQMFKVIFNGTCLEACPAEAPISNSGRCAEKCPEGTVVMDLQCVSPSSCTDMVIYNDTCVETCPPGSPLIANNVCHETCPEHFYRLDLGCVTANQCIDLQKVIFNGTCLSICPKAYIYIDNHTCVETCPKHLVTMLHQCVTETGCIAQGRVIYNNTCLQSCPSECPYSSRHRCNLVCPNTTLHVVGENTCVTPSECISQGRSVANKTCTKSCPENLSNRYKGICYSKCPSGLLSKNSVGVQNYDCSLKFGSKCVTSCPANAPYRDHDTCYITCPDDKLNFNGSQCIYSTDCTSKKMYVYDGECFRKCPKGTYPVKALSSCISAEQPRTSLIAMVALLCVSIPLVISCWYIPKKSRKMNASKAWIENEEPSGLEDNNFLIDQLGDELQTSEEQISLHEIFDSRDGPSVKDKRDSGHEVDTGGLEVSVDDAVSAEVRAETCSIIIHNNPQEDEDQALLTRHEVTGNEHDDDDAMLFADGGA